MQFHLFPKEVYINRRKALQERIGSGLILLMGNRESSMNYRDNWYPFRQDSTFLYYFGLDVANLAAVIDVDSGEATIFGDELSIDDIIWTGPLPTIREMAEMVGITRTAPYQQAGEVLKQAKNRHIHHLKPYRPENSIQLNEWLSQQNSSIDLIKAIIAQRAYKEDIEVKEIDQAVTISADMHMAAIQHVRPGMKEYELVAKVEEVAAAHNSRLSYPVILTVNGHILHNHYHGHTIEAGQMILNDAGAENPMHYAGDLTRTFPVGREFTPRQKEIYQMVLGSMDHAISLLRPGITFREVHTHASETLLSGLKAIGLVKGDPAEAVAAGVHTLFFQCGLGHMMGLDVHDMEDLGEEYVGYTDTLKKSTEFGWKSLRLGRELEKGFVLTVEPGIYMIPELIDRWMAEKKLESFINYKAVAAYRDFGGIRIEDNFLITEDGSRKLGKHLPKTLKEIEALRQQH